MKDSTQIVNWLKIGFEQPTGSLTELFYYDKRDSEFFSIMAVDYFMLDEDMNIASNVTSSYSKVQENSLVDRIKRIEYNDPDIISIPRINLEDRKNFMQEFVDTFSDKKLIAILNQRVQNQDYKTGFDFYFGNEADESIKLEWEKIKDVFLRQKVDTFLNLNNINIENSTLWIVDSKGSISFSLTDDKKSDDLPIINKRQIRKAWWKFWK